MIRTLGTLGIVSVKAAHEILSVVATLLPFKAVIIAAGTGVPWFIPGFIAQRGALFAALSLIVVAIISAVSAVGLGRYSEYLDWRSLTDKKRDDPYAPDFFSESRQVRSTDSASLYLVVFAFLCILLLVSWLQFLLLGLTLILTWSWAIWASAKNKDSPGRTSPESKFAAVVAKGSTWIAVGTALAAQFIHQGPSDVTALLIAIILTRHSLSKLPKVVLANAGSKKSSDIGDGQPLESKRPTRNLHPSVTLLQNVSRAVKTDVGCRQIFGEGGGPSFATLPVLGKGVITLVGQGQGTTGNTVISRVFLASKKAEMLREITFFSLGPIAKMTGDAQREMFLLAEIVGSKLTLSKRQSFGQKGPTVRDSLNWQIRLERECLTVGLKNDETGLRFTRPPLDDLKETLQEIAGFPGSQSGAIRTLLETWAFVEAAWGSAPLSFGFLGGVSPKRFIALKSGGLVLIDASEWMVAPLGSLWPKLEAQRKILESALLTNNVNGDTIHAVLICSEIQQLNRAAKTLNFEELANSAARLLSKADLKI